MPGAKQRDATQFIIEHVFDDVAWLNHEAILSRIEGSGAMQRVQQIQATNLNSLLSTTRMVRMTEASLVDDDAYSLIEFFDDLREGVWSELTDGERIDTLPEELAEDAISSGSPT